MKKVYVAGRWAQWQKVRSMQQALSRRGFSVTYDWTAVAEFCVEEADEDMPACAARDLEGCADADIVVALIEPGCRGSWLEMGYALAKGARVYVVSTPDVGEHVFFHAPKVSWRRTDDKAWPASDRHNVRVIADWVKLCEETQVSSSLRAAESLLGL